MFAIVCASLKFPGFLNSYKKKSSRNGTNVCLHVRTCTDIGNFQESKAFHYFVHCFISVPRSGPGPWHMLIKYQLIAGLVRDWGAHWFVWYGILFKVFKEKTGSWDLQGTEVLSESSCPSGQIRWLHLRQVPFGLCMWGKDGNMSQQELPFTFRPFRMAFLPSSFYSEVVFCLFVCYRQQRLCVGALTGTNTWKWHTAQLMKVLSWEWDESALGKRKLLSLAKTEVRHWTGGLNPLWNQWWPEKLTPIHWEHVTQTLLPCGMGSLDWKARPCTAVLASIQFSAE